MKAPRWGLGQSRGCSAAAAPPLPTAPADLARSHGPLRGAVVALRGAQAEGHLCANCSAVQQSLMHSSTCCNVTRLGANYAAEHASCWPLLAQGLSACTERSAPAPARSAPSAALSSAAPSVPGAFGPKTMSTTAFIFTSAQMPQRGREDCLSTGSINACPHGLIERFWTRAGGSSKSSLLRRRSH